MAAHKTHVYNVEHVCSEHGIYTEVMAWVPGPGDFRPELLLENLRYCEKQGCPHCGMHGKIKIDQHKKVGPRNSEKEYAIINSFGD